MVGDNTVSSVTFQGLPQDVKRGDRILIDDGLIEMVVESTTDTDVVCTVINGGTISSHKGINVRESPCPCPSSAQRTRLISLSP